MIVDVHNHYYPPAYLDALRSAFIGMTEGLLRDQVVARRSECRAEYNSADIRKVLETMLPAVAS